MNYSEIERKLEQAEVVRVQGLRRDPKGFLPENLNGSLIERMEAIAAPHLPAPTPNPGGKAAETQPPYILEVEVNCEECGGSGFDPGGLDPWGPEPCAACHGAKTQRIARNFLAEAFQIVTNLDSARTVERQHLVAIIHHCRELISALVALPELTGPRSGEHEEPCGSAKPITHFKRSKHEITFRPQRARSRKRAAAGG